MTILMLGFFLLQGTLVLVESLLGATKWRPLAAHLWTVAWMAGTSPLFTEPLLRVMGV
jgi:hypothetical protein